MVNYGHSKIYFIKNRRTGDVIWSGGTVSDHKRRFWNHRCNKNDKLYKFIEDNNINWRDLTIEVIKDYDSCRDRTKLNFAAETILQYYRQGHIGVYQNFIDNLEYYID